MKKIMSLVVFFAIAGAVGCGNSGGDLSGPTLGLSQNNQVLQIVRAFCDPLVSCHPDHFTDAECQSEILTMPDFVNDFGGKDTDVLLTVAQQVESGSLALDQAVFNKCLTDLQSTTCEETLFGFDPNNPDNLFNLENLVPGESSTCGGLFE